MRAADVVHIHSNWTFPVWWGAWLALRNRKTLVMSPHGALDPVRLRHSAWKKRLVGWLDRWLLRRASVMHATCGDEKRWIQAFLERKEERGKRKEGNTNIHLRQGYGGQVQHSTSSFANTATADRSNVEHPIGEKPRIVVIPNGVGE